MSRQSYAIYDCALDSDLLDPCPLLLMSSDVCRMCYFLTICAAEGWRLNFPHACQARSKGIDASLSDPLLRHLKGRKGRHQGPQITYLQFCWFLVIFFFILAVINDFYWKDMYICIHFIKYTYLFHFPWRIYTSMCFSDATPGRGGRANIYIYITLLQGGVEQKKYIYIFARPPQLPVRRKCAGCGQWGLDRCQCQVKKMEHLGTSTGDTWGRSRDTQGWQIGTNKVGNIR